MTSFRREPRRQKSRSKDWRYASTLALSTFLYPSLKLLPHRYHSCKTFLATALLHNPALFFSSSLFQSCSVSSPTFMFDLYLLNAPCIVHELTAQERFSSPGVSRTAPSSGICYFSANSYLTSVTTLPHSTWVSSSVWLNPADL